ncbi:MAG: PAS domain S-box protein, partial [candidate division Zixibacteria bacterium]|nr:PAS domain S-box protein [Candidatus Tariuqbacter arcticus]
MNGVFNRREYIEAIFRDLPDAIVTLDSEYRIVEWNPGAAKLFGYEKEETAGKNLDELIAGKDHFQEADSLTKVVLSGEEVSPRETVRCRKDGVQVEVMVAGSPIKGERDEVIGVVAVYKDISALKKADRLREFSLTMAERVSQAEDLQEFYQLVHNDLKKVIPAENCFIALLDKELKRIVFPYFVDQYDAPPVERELANGITEYIINSEEAIYAFKETFQELARSGEIEIFGTPPEALLGAPMKVKGETIGALVVQDYHSRETYKESDKDIIKFLAEAIALAIERKKTEEALRETYDYLKNLLDYANAPIIVWDPNFRITRFNHAFERLTGRNADEVLGRTLDLLFPEDSKEEAMAHIRRAMAGERWETVEILILCADGTVKTVLWNSATLYAEDGKTVVATIAQGQDITDRKQTERALKESEEKYRTLVEKVQDGLFVIQDGLMAFVNEAFASMVGYTVDEAIGMDFRKLVAPEDLEMVAKRYKDRQEGKPVPPTYEFRMLHKDGKTIIYVFMSVGIISYRGKAASMGTVQDITKRKRAEEALRKSERQYRTVVENAREFIWQLDTEGKFVFVNEFAKEVSGYDGLNDKGAPYTPLIHPDDLEKVNDVFKDTLAGNVNNYDVRIYTEKGELVELRVQTIPIYEKEKVVGTISFGRDITEQKRAEEELRESEDKLQIILESANDLVIQLTPTGFVKYL